MCTAIPQSPTAICNVLLLFFPLAKRSAVGRIGRVEKRDLARKFFPSHLSPLYKTVLKRRFLSDLTRSLLYLKSELGPTKKRLKNRLSLSYMPISWQERVLPSTLSFVCGPQGFPVFSVLQCPRTRMLSMFDFYLDFFSPSTASNCVCYYCVHCTVKMLVVFFKKAEMSPTEIFCTLLINYKRLSAQAYLDSFKRAGRQTSVKNYCARQACWLLF